MEPLDSDHSVFYHILKASSCKVKSSARNCDVKAFFSSSVPTIDENNYPLPQSTFLINTQANLNRNITQANEINITSSTADVRAQPQMMRVITGEGCCSSCLQLLDIIRTEQQKLHTNGSRFVPRVEQDRMTVYHRDPNPPLYLISNVTGGTVLHALLQSYHCHCPQLLRAFLMDGNEYLTTQQPGNVDNDNNDTGSHQLNMMLLHRDRYKEFPIHLAVSVLSSCASTTVSITLLQLLLHQTLMAQQNNISLYYSTINCDTCERHRGVEIHYHNNQACKYLPPHILSFNEDGRSILDILFHVYISVRDGTSSNAVRTDYDRRGLLQKQMVDQIVRSQSSGHFVIHFIQTVTIIIRAAYIELQLLQQHCRPWQCSKVSNEISHQIQDFRPIDEDIANLPSTKKEDDEDKYILHFASAFCRPKSGSIAFGASARFGRPSFHQFFKFMHLDESILTILLHCWGVDAIRLVHPMTGQVPLHYAVRSYCSFFCTDHRRMNTPKDMELCQIRLHGDKHCHEWVQTLLRIAPETCMVKDRYGYTPLHYAIFQNAYDCDCCDGDEPGTSYADARSCLIETLIQACPPSIDVPCPLYVDRCTVDGHFCSLPRMLMWSDDERKGMDATTTDSIYNFEVFQLAAMMHPRSLQGSCTILSFIYTTLRMSPSRLFVGGIKL